MSGVMWQILFAYIRFRGTCINMQNYHCKSQFPLRMREFKIQQWSIYRCSYAAWTWTVPNFIVILQCRQNAPQTEQDRYFPSGEVYVARCWSSKSVYPIVTNHTISFHNFLIASSAFVDCKMFLTQQTPGNNILCMSLLGIGCSYKNLLSPTHFAELSLLSIGCSYVNYLTPPTLQASSQLTVCRSNYTIN